MIWGAKPDEDELEAPPEPEPEPEPPEPEPELEPAVVEDVAVEELVTVEVETDREPEENRVVEPMVDVVIALLPEEIVVTIALVVYGWLEPPEIAVPLPAPVEIAVAAPVPETPALAQYAVPAARTEEYSALPHAS